MSISVEAPQYFSTLKSLKHCDILSSPDPGGRYEPNFSLDQTVTIARPIDRFLPPTELQQPESRPHELSPELKITPQIKEAGYDVLMEIRRLLRNINSGLDVELAANELEINLRTYDLEIIKSRPVLPHLNRFDFKNGILRMVGNDGELVVDAISVKERNGSVLEASITIENFLLSAENNSFAVLMNPAGWNGFTDEYGNEAEPHLNAEIMVFWKDKNSQLKGLTLVADLKEEQAQKTMISLGVSPQLLTGETEHERLASIVRNPALLSLPEAYANPFTYVLDKVLAQRGDKDFQLRMRKGLPEVRSVMEVRADIKRFEELLLLSQEEEKLITEPKRFILENAAKLDDKSVQQEIINKIEKAILLLTREYRNSTGVYPKVAMPVFSSVIPASFVVIPAEAGIYINNHEDNFSAEIAFLQTRSGCPASIAARILGGSSLGSSMEGSSSGGIVEFDQYGSLEFQCPHTDCGKINRRQRGQLIPNCQHCGKSVRC